MSIYEYSNIYNTVIGNELYSKPNISPFDSRFLKERYKPFIVKLHEALENALDGNKNPNAQPN